MPLFPLSFLPDMFEAIALLILVVIGIFIVIKIVKIIMFLLIPTMVALVVWLLTGSLFLAGIAFLIISIIFAIKH